VGQNAHGKTTLLRIVAGELQPNRGEIEYPWLLQGGTHRIDWPSVKRHIAFVPQELPAWQGSLGDTLHYEAALHGLYGQDNERAVSFIVERLGLGRHLDKRWAHLSGGYKVRFALARALVWKPRLLVMDEPLANLDVKAKGVLLQDIRDLARSYSHPIAVILSSHDLHNLESVCGQMLFLNDGQVRYSGDIRSIGAQRSHNEFEVGTSLPLVEIRERLKESFIENVREVGLNLLLCTERQVQSVQVLQLLLERGIDVRYFRDNSTSIRSLFD
jgi:ABC-type multidrug transport system ATPase subunit